MAIRKRALVTGGAGFIGSHLCEELLFEHGMSVVVIDDLSTSSRSNLVFVEDQKNFKFYKGSVLDKKLTERLVRDCDIVYHLAAAVGVKRIIEHPLSSMLTNIDGSQNIFYFASKYRKKVVFASTSEVYGKHSCSASDEEDDRILGPTSISRWSYSESKAVDEFLALAYAREKGLSVVIVRFFNTAGPRQSGSYGMVLPRFIQQASLGKPLTVYGDGAQVRSFSHVKDVVRAAADLSLEPKASGKIFNVGNDKPVTIRALAQKVRKKLNSDSEIRYIPLNKAYGNFSAGFEDIGCRIPSLSKVKKFINYKPKYDLDAIIEDAARYYRDKKKGGAIA